MLKKVRNSVDRPQTTASTQASTATANYYDKSTFSFYKERGESYFLNLVATPCISEESSPSFTD